MATPPHDRLNRADVHENGEKAPEELSQPTTTAQWKPLTRIAFRFCFAYFAFGVINPIALVPIPNADVPDLSVLWPMRQITLWTAAHIFHVTASFSHPTGGGDTTYDWINLFCTIVMAIGVTAVWSLMDRRRANYVTLHKWFQLFVRFALAEAMFSYGFGKVFRYQMPDTPLKMLVLPFGEFNKHAVLWNSIGAAPAYEIFAGCAEVLGGLLLILPATTTLGALVCFADLTQVFTLNLAYDINVKLFSFYLLLLSLFLLAPDIPRFVSFFFTNRPTVLTTQPTLFRTARACRTALVLQVFLGVYQMGVNIYNWGYVGRMWDRSWRSAPLYGIWDVQQMAIDGKLRPPLLTDSERWRRVLFNWDGPDEVAFQRIDDTFLYYTSSERPQGLLIKDAGPIPEYGYPGNEDRSGDFTVDRPAPDKLILDGTLGESKIHAELKRLDLNQFPLVKGGFHLIQPR